MGKTNKKKITVGDYELVSFFAFYNRIIHS